MSFWKDVAELKKLTNERLEQGYGQESLRLAMKDEAEKAASSSSPKTKRSHKKTFLLAFLGGLLWQSSRRRK